MFGESPISRAHCHPLRYWSINNATIPEADKQHHLGVLRTVYPTSVQRTVERCSAGRGAFFSLNVVGTRFGCLHPLTSLRLYSTFCRPVMLYGCELWVPSKLEFLMLERVHRKILRTIQGLPIRCSRLALQILVGLPSVSSIIFQRQLAFLHSFSAMSPNSLPLQLMLLRLSSLPRKGLIFHLQHILVELSLPSLSDILRGSWSRSVWKRQVKSITLGREFSQFLDTCDHLPLSRCLLSLGKPAPHWAVTRGYPKLSSKTLSRVQQLGS